jgi:protoheme IX farnesyltransferase
MRSVCNSVVYQQPATPAGTPSRQNSDNLLRLGVLAPSWWHLIADLTKIRIATLSTLSAATGYVVFCHTVNRGILTASLGVLLLATGACALNQFQDREFDARMTRTRHRPISSGAMRPATALALAALLIASGFLILWLAHNLAAAIIGLFAVVWYNGIYTYLKRAWAFAVVPGALIGALPPAVGWTAAGGAPLDPRVFALCFFFFIWQVPHFWLLLFVFGNDYENAGLPSLTKLFSLRQLAGLTFIWMLATFVSSLLFPIYRLTQSPWINLGLVASGLWLAWEALRFLNRYSQHRSFRPAFLAINIYALLVMALLVADALF